MPINTLYSRPDDLPRIIPLLPLESALLLPRGEMPLNIFEPRYMTLVDDVMKGDRMIGMIQPLPDAETTLQNPPLAGVGCLGRITAIQETGDGRYLITLTGITRFHIEEEQPINTPYRQARVNYERFITDFEPGAGEENVDRASILKTLEAFLDANKLEADWSGIKRASNEALVNALSMMSPYGTREKQALLEAEDLKTRAEILVAVTEMELAKVPGSTDTTLQ